jgi:hypothetical protein
VPRAATRENTITGIAWHQPFKWTRLRLPIRTNVVYPAREVPFVPNTGTVDTWLMRWQGPPRIVPRLGYFALPRRPLVTFTQTVNAGIELTVEFHICGWGTAQEQSIGFADQAQAGDNWSSQSEEDTDWDEKDECGR